MFRFYRECIAEAFRDTLNRALAIAAVAFAVAGFAIPRLFPEQIALFTELTWQIPLASLMTVFLLRMARSPYDICERLTRSTHKRILELETECERLKDSRARLEIRFEPRPPYQPHDLEWYRVGIYNHGPATARDVKARLVEIAPANPLPDYLLPSILTWKGGGLMQNIVPGQERELDVLAYRDGQFVEGDVVWIRLCLTETASGRPAEFALQNGMECRLHLEVTTTNAADPRPLRPEFVVRADRPTVRFYPVR